MLRLSSGARRAAALLFWSIAAPAAADPLEMVLTSVGPARADGTSVAQLTFLNDRSAAVIVVVPDRVEASVVVAGVTTTAALVRSGGVARSISVAAGGFARIPYTVRLPATNGAVAFLTLPGRSNGYAFGVAADTPRTAANTRADPKLVAAQTLSPSADTGNAFLGNLSSYEPIYAVYGPGTSTDAFIQISFKYQLFGRGNTPADERKLADGVTFGYTQRMYWDLGAKSAPFRNIDFQPELFYLVTARPLIGDLLIGGQAGIRHESNGRDGTASRSLNTVYVHPTVTLPVGDYTLQLGPQAWAYVGSLSDNPDVSRYRGNAGLSAEIGRYDGLRLSTSGRINFATGRGAIDAELSYPLTRIFRRSPDLYVFGQAFAGYGENLLDYNRRATRLRFGFGFVR